MLRTQISKSPSITNPKQVFPPTIGHGGCRPPLVWACGTTCLHTGDPSALAALGALGTTVTQTTNIHMEANLMQGSYCECNR